MIGIGLSQKTLRDRYKKHGKNWIQDAIKLALETDDNSRLYKRKEYANRQIKHKRR